MRILKKWHPREFVLAGEPVKLLLRAIPKGESVQFLRGIQKLADDAKEKAGGADTPTVEQAAALMEMLDGDFARQAFARYVKPGEPIQEEDGPEIATGEQIFELATVGTVQAVLHELEMLCAIGQSQAKASGSPSTSSSGGGSEPEPSVSPATSTVSGAGIEPSTAMAIPTSNGSSSLPA